MPRLSEITDTDYMPQPEVIPADIPRVYIGGQGIENRDAVEGDKPSAASSIADKILNKLFRDDEQRYQLWPEKVIRSALTAIPEGMAGKYPQWEVDPNTGDVHTSPQMIERAQDMSALAGTGGLSGVTDATLGATPFLRPALKYKDRLYKGKEGQQHMDVIPENLYPEFQKMAMNGEDISHYNFGFVNDKGHFLDREAALKYGIDTGLIDQQAGKFGALTSTLMADSSRPGTAIEAVAKTAQPFYSALEHNISKIPQSKMTGEQWLGTLSNKSGVKPEELDWTGVKSFLEENKSKPVTKAELEQHMAANKIELKEVNHGNVNYNNTAPDKIATEKYQKQWDEVVLEKNQIQNLADKARRDYDNGRPVDPEGVKAHMREKALTKTLDDLHEKMVRETLERLGGEQKAPKYSSWQLPGGENYREKLLTLPEKDISSNWNIVKHPTAEGQYAIKNSKGEYGLNPNGIGEAKFASPQEARNAINYDYAPTQEKFDYKSPHWDEPNILAHVRMNDRVMHDNVNKVYTVQNTTTNRKLASFKTEEEAKAAASKIDNTKVIEDIQPKKSLHLEEIQSDWHQKGRDKGYRSNKVPTKEDIELKFIKSEVPAGHNASNYPGYWESFDKQGNMIGRHGGRLTKEQAMDEALGDLKHKASGIVPDAPFKKTWHELALKRMIREAAEKGYDRLSWTPGEAQAARYDLSKTLNKVSYNPQQKYLKAWDKHGNEVIAKEGVTPENLAEYVGKEGAQKILEQNPKDFKHISSFKRDQLKVDSSDEHMYKVTAPDGRSVNVGKGTVGSEAEALEYGERYLNKSAFEINNRRELEYGRLGPTHILEGANLKVGGEGMKGFYDQIIPKALEKIGKEHGVKVKTYSPKKVEASPEEINKLAKTLYETYDRKGGEPSWENLHPNKKAHYINTAKEKSYLADNPEHTVHYIDIPQSLRDAAMNKGFPLFSSTHMFIPVDHEPEFKKNATTKR